jgi:FKBP-type peptidyl-prolyl cis-trans isomerase 2
MRTVQQGDRVRIHYVKRFQDGSVASSQGRAPLELTVGTNHARVPGLALALVGLAPGESTRIKVPAQDAYGLADPARVRRLDRRRFLPNQPLAVGQWVRLLGRQGRARRVRILETLEKVVVVDTNHPKAGQDLELEVELVSIQGPDAG